MGPFEGNTIHKSRDDHGALIITQDNMVRSLYFDSQYKQSSMSLLHPAILVLRYTQVMMSCLLFCDPRTVLMVGLGGGSLARFLTHYYPQVDVDVVEIRAQVVKLAHDYFDVPENDPQLKIHIGDGREFILSEADPQYDLILLDAYDGFGPADAMKGDELFRACKRRLTERGVLVTNLWNRRADNFSHTCRTIKAAFSGNTLRYTLGRQNGNVIVMASKHAFVDLDNASMKQKARELETKTGLNFPALLYELNQQNRPFFARMFGR